MSTTLRTDVFDFLTTHHFPILLQMTDSDRRMSNLDITMAWWKREIDLLLESEEYQLAQLAIAHTAFERLTILEWTIGTGDGHVCTIAIDADGLSYDGKSQLIANSDAHPMARCIAMDMTRTHRSSLALQMQFADTRTLLADALRRAMENFTETQDQAREARAKQAPPTPHNEDRDAQGCKLY